MSETTPGTDRLSVDVCVCTFRRESLGATLESLAAQARPDRLDLQIIVADNDEAPSAQARVAALAARLDLRIRYLHCPARNISLARNGALAAARADWVAFIDDDETASPGWLAALLAKARAEDADVVLGPVRPVYAAEAPAWMRSSRMHAIEPTIKDGRIVQGYTSNALLRRNAPAVAGQQFDVALGRSGGEDTEFFDRLIRRGAHLAYAPDAVVEEVVPPERQTLAWLARRRFRAGQTHGRLLARARPGPTARAADLTTSLAKAAVSAGVAVLNVSREERRYFWALRAVLHTGVAARLCGLSELTLYGAGPGSTPPDERTRTADQEPHLRA